ncbi:uncharacterized protein LOC141826821 [Curcuma longa]|uniref:uncharacterized protein LOC141826821 n=1 Tax=Curcuma longa TaxID=136217 RepID=UPI003D9F26C2
MAEGPAIPSVTPSASFGISEDAAAREGDRPSQPEEDFEFTFPTGCAPNDQPTATADELFSHGRVLPIYPVFDRSLVLHWPDEHEANGPERQGSDCQLLIEESRTSLGSISSSSFDTDDLASVAVRKYCPRTTWSAPQSPDRRRESASAKTGRRWRLQDVLFGSRTSNQSDSQKKSLFLKFPSSPPSERIPSPSPKPCRNRKAATGLWRFFLPYRPELFGRFKAQKRPFQ